MSVVVCVCVCACVCVLHLHTHLFLRRAGLLCLFMGLTRLPNAETHTHAHTRTHTHAHTSACVPRPALPLFPIQHAGECLRPHVPAVVRTFLTAMSAFESAKLSYLQQHADGNSGMHDIGMTGEELEQRRVSAASGSVFGEVLDKCVQQITGDNIAGTCDEVKGTLKSGLGLPTRAGAARFLVSLVNTVGVAMRDHCGALLKTLGNGLKHPSVTVRSEYGKAAAYLCRVAKNGAVKKYVARLHAMVAEADSSDADARKTAGRAMCALVHHAGDKVKRYMVEIMPLVFLAMHDPEEEVADVWRDAWTSLAPSPAHSMRLYLKEIVRARCVGCVVAVAVVVVALRRAR